MANKERIRHSVPALRHDGERGRLDRRGGVSAYHLGKHAVKPENLSVPLWNDIAHARSQAAVVEANRAVWDRAQTIEEDGRLLVEKLKGLIAKSQLDEEVVEALDIAVSDHYALTVLDPDDPEQLAAIRATADMVTSEVARIEGILDSDNPNVWYSSIKQTYDEITSTVAMLNSAPGAPGQFSAISQTASRIEAVVATLNENSPWDGHSQFSSITQTADQISLIVSQLENPDLDDPDHFAIIRAMIDEIDLRVRTGDVISAINLTPGNVRILGKYIQLNGDVEVLGTFKVGEANIEDLSVGTIKIKDSAVTLGKLDALQAEGSVFTNYGAGSFPESGQENFWFYVFRHKIPTPSFSRFAALPLARLRIHAESRTVEQPPVPYTLQWVSDWTPWHLVYHASNGGVVIPSGSSSGSTRYPYNPIFDPDLQDFFEELLQYDLGRYQSMQGRHIDFKASTYVRNVESTGFELLAVAWLAMPIFSPGQIKYEWRFRVELEWARWGLEE